MKKSIIGTSGLIIVFALIIGDRFFLKEETADDHGYEVPEIDVSGDEVKDWKYKDDYYYHEGEIFIEDYLGAKDHIVIPTTINGKKVVNLDSFGLKI